MSTVWLDPGTHAVQFHESASSAHACIAEFFTMEARPADPLLIVSRRTTFDGVAALLASGRYGPPIPTDRIHFADAEEALRTIMDGDMVDPARGGAYLKQLLADVRRRHSGGTVRFCGEIVDILCERGNLAAALVLEGLAGDLFAFEPRLSILCCYARARFPEGVNALETVCAMHTDAGPVGRMAQPSTQGEVPPPQTVEVSSAPTVYIIDDDVSVRRSLARFLKLSGWRLRTFGSGEELLAELDRLSAGCLVIDVQLAAMNGLDLLVYMRAVRPTWPAIVMSGSNDDNTESEALRLGARAFLHKPFAPQVLLDAITGAIAS